MIKLFQRENNKMTSSAFLDCKEFHRLFDERVKLNPNRLATGEEHREYTASKAIIQHHLKICKICSKGEECPAK